MMWRLAFPLIGRANVECVVLDVTQLVLTVSRRVVAISEGIDELLSVAASLRHALAVRGLHLEECLLGT